MRPQRHRARAIPLFPVLVLLLMAGSAAAEWSPGKGRIWVGPPADPERYYRFATDNGIPGTGRYAYFDYNWPSLRQALRQYGLFGRRYGKQNPMGPNCSAMPAAPAGGAYSIPPNNRPSNDVRTPPEDPLLLKPPRKLDE